MCKYFAINAYVDDAMLLVYKPMFVNGQTFSVMCHLSFLHPLCMLSECHLTGHYGKSETELCSISKKKGRKRIF